jgi:hypothetical protein
MHDKSFWRKIVDTEYAVPDGYTAVELTGELFGYLSLPDPELRDKFGYFIFSSWVLADRLTVDYLRTLIPRLQELLTTGIGEQGTDTVFGRTFGALWLAVIVYYDNHHRQFMTEAETRSVMNSALTYFAQERDLRGYVAGKGWAHSCAHTADLIDELVQHRHLGAADVVRMLNAIAHKAQALTGIIYQHEEDERMAYAVVTAFQNKLVTAEIVTVWLKPFEDWAEEHPRYSYSGDPAMWGCYVNVKNLLRSIYTRLNIAEDVTDAARMYIPAVQKTLKLYTLRM